MRSINTVLAVKNLTKTFISGEFFTRKKTQIHAVKDLSFDLKEGEILGLLGPNGSGKTTTIQMLIGTLKPTHGLIYYFGKEFHNNRSDTLQHIAFVSSSVQLPTTLTVWQNLDIHGRLYGLSAEQRAVNGQRLLQSFGMWHVRNVSVGCLSFGQTMRVMLAKAFLAHPKIVIIDEATSVLDPEIAREVRRFLLKHRDLYNTSIILASHNMAEVAEICDRILVIKDGSIIANDTPQTLIKEISKIRLSFECTSNNNALTHFLEKNHINYSNNAQMVNIDVKEEEIAYIFQLLGTEGIYYKNVSIDRPTLEDYFLKVTTQSYPKLTF